MPELRFKGSVNNVILEYFFFLGLYTLSAVYNIPVPPETVFKA